MKKTTNLTMWCLIAIALMTMTSAAMVATRISYQGRLLDTDGIPVDDRVYSLRFTIYDSATEGVVLWSSDFQDVEVVEGLFTVLLGEKPMPSLPNDIFTDPTVYLGITVERQAEMVPRTRLVSVPYAYQSLRADTAGCVNWTAIEDIPSDFADGTDDVGESDITAVLAGTGLSGGGSTGDVTLSLASSISGTHAFTGYIDFDNRVDLKGANSSVSIDYNNNHLYGLKSVVNRTSAVGDYAYTYGVRAEVEAPLDERYAVSSFAEGDGTKANGNSFGVRSIAWDGAKAYGLYGWAYNAHQGYGVYGGASTDYNDYAYAGWFSGDVEVTGTLSKGGGSFKIDHPLDPENKYLQHSFVESPDMMNVYNGNVVTDGEGLAVVDLPDYFAALNKDFRYQLTVIGEFAQAIVAEEITGNRFTIRTDQPNIKVSWQVTGVRRDAWAENHRIEVETDKPIEEVGTYLHPKEFGQPLEKQVDYEEMKAGEEEFRSR